MTIADDLFAGAGGWDLAAQRLGIHPRGVENMTEARATRAAAGLTTIHDDVWTFRPDQTAVGQITSPPCPTFSTAGKGSGRRHLDTVLAAIRSGEWTSIQRLRQLAEVVDDDRTALVLTPLHFAMANTYQWLAWEQVPPVLPIWEACAEVLRGYGWHVWTGIVHAEQHGVPQTRSRAVLIANRAHPVGAPVATHSRYHSRTPSRLDPGVAKWVSMAEALGWPPVDLVGFPRRADSADVVTLNDVGYHARDLRPASDPSQTVTEKSRPWQRFHPHGDACTCEVELHTPTQDRAYDRSNPRTPCQPAPTIAVGNASAQLRWDPRETTPDGLPRFAQQSDNTPDYLWPDNRPATVVAGRDIVQAPGATANRFNGSTKSRNDGVRVSVAEAGVLQSFPADHPWQGNKTKRFLQAGNAVPPLMAAAILEAATRDIFTDPETLFA